MRCTPRGKSQRRRRPISSPPSLATRVAPSPELGPRALHASRLAATRRAAMRRRLGHQGRRWPTAARAGLSVPRKPWTLLQGASCIKGATGAPTRLSPFPSSAIALRPWSSVARASPLSADQPRTFPNPRGSLPKTHIDQSHRDFARARSIAAAAPPPRRRRSLEPSPSTPTPPIDRWRAHTPP
jgi:hypothetical protein